VRAFEEFRKCRSHTVSLPYARRLIP
jgi:hypothetical protein